MVVSRTPTLTQAEYERIALADEPEIKWELHDGTLREKPWMTLDHDFRADDLAELLIRQLERRSYMVNQGRTRLRSPSGNNHIPDLCVLPRPAAERARRERPRGLGVYDMPLPLVVEVWSSSTGRYDVETKFPDYRLRGDLEIWRVHPLEHTVTTWVRQPDGSYSERLYTSGVIHLCALPGVSIDLADLFAD